MHLIKTQVSNSHTLLKTPPPPPPGGALPLEDLPDARESPSQKHPNRGFNGILKDK